jgi:uncharacterized protein YkwD
VIIPVTSVRNHLILITSLLVASLHAAPSGVDEILAAFQTIAEQGGDVGELQSTIEELPGAEQKSLAAEVEKIWPKIRDGYITDLQQTARGLAANRGDTRSAIRTHRAEFQRVYAMDEGPMKPLLKSVSMPAIEALRKLITPEPSQIIEAGGEPLKQRRALAFSLAGFRDLVLEAMISTTPVDSVDSLHSAEKLAAEAISGFDRNDLKILEQNRRITESEEVPADEAHGIEECNLMRMLVGLGALTLDPKLCDASRDHSKDMAELGFFAHDSPVPGKTSPWDRARNFKTTASGENIFAGSSDPHAANMGWFYSPGHHKNMFSAGQTRIGLGHHAGRWTQMFGS